MEHRKRQLASASFHNVERSIPSGGDGAALSHPGNDNDDRKVRSRGGWHRMVMTKFFLLWNILWFGTTLKAVSQNGHRSSRYGNSMKSPSVPTTGRIILTITRFLVVAFGFVALLLGFNFLSSSQRGHHNGLQRHSKNSIHNAESNLFHSVSNMFPTLSVGDVPSEYLPQRPRVMGLILTSVTGTKRSLSSFDHYQTPQRKMSHLQYNSVPDHLILVGAIALNPNHDRHPHFDANAHNRLIKVDPDSLKAQKYLLNSESYDDHKADDFEDENCTKLYDWQLLSYPSCNIVLEQDLTDFSSFEGSADSENDSDDSNSGSEPEEETNNVKVRILGNGYWRDVWQLTNVNPSLSLSASSSSYTTTKTILKTMRYTHDYTERNYDRHRRDGVAMERLSASPHIVDIYGFCGNSGVFQFADGGDSEQNIWRDDYYRRHKLKAGHVMPKEWNSTEKLLVAYQMVSGLADVHKLHISHADISHGQFVYVSEEGKWKLNDFNRCRFIRWNEKLQDYCPFEIGSNPGEVRDGVFVCLCISICL